MDLPPAWDDIYEPANTIDSCSTSRKFIFQDQCFNVTSMSPSFGISYSRSRFKQRYINVTISLNLSRTFWFSGQYCCCWVTCKPLWKNDQFVCAQRGKRPLILHRRLIAGRSSDIVNTKHPQDHLKWSLSYRGFWWCRLLSNDSSGAYEPNRREYFAAQLCGGNQEQCQAEGWPEICHCRDWTRGAW